jgi:hypothetical protein
VFSTLYIFRFIAIPSRTEKKMLVDYSYTSRFMKACIWITSALVLASGALLFVLPAMIGANAPELSLLEIAAESAAIAAGFGIAYVLYVRRPLKRASEETLKYRLLHNSFFINIFYDWTIYAFVAIARWIEDFDSMIDRVADSGGQGIVLLADKVRLIENGDVSSYATVFMIGMIMVVLLGFLLGVF